MLDPSFVLLFVDSPARSQAFYSTLLGREAAESSPTFAMFVLGSGVRLGFWSKHTAEPTPGPVGGCELAFTVADAEAVDRTHRDWQERGLSILQPPTDLDFGRTFVALDPDGHRLRVLAPV